MASVLASPSVRGTSATPGRDGSAPRGLAVRSARRSVGGRKSVSGAPRSGRKSISSKVSCRSGGKVASKSGKKSAGRPRRALGSLDVNNGRNAKDATATPEANKFGKGSSMFNGSGRGAGIAVHDDSGSQESQEAVIRELRGRLEAVAATSGHGDSSAATMPDVDGGSQDSHQLRKKLSSTQVQLEQLQEEGRSLFEAYTDKCDRLKQLSVKAEDLRVAALEKDLQIEELKEKMKGSEDALNSMNDLMELMDDMGAVFSLHEKYDELASRMGGGATAALDDAIIDERDKLKALLEDKTREMEALAEVSRERITELEEKLSKRPTSSTPDSPQPGTTAAEVSSLSQQLEKLAMQMTELREFGVNERKIVDDANKSLKTQVASLTEQMTTMQGLLEEAGAELKAKESTSTEMTETFDKLTAELESARSEKQDTAGKLQAALEEITKLKRRVGELEGDFAAAKQDLADATAIAAQEAAAAAAAQQAKEELQTDLEATEKQADETRQEMESIATQAAASAGVSAEVVAGFERQIASLQEQLSSSKAQCDDLVKQVDTLKAEHKSQTVGFTARAAEAEKRNTELEEQVRILEGRMAESAEHLEASDKTIAAQAEELAQATTSCKQLESDKAQLMEQLDELCDSLDDADDEEGSAVLERQLGEANEAVSAANAQVEEARASEAKHKEYLMLYKAKSDEKIAALQQALGEAEEDADSADRFVQSVQAALTSTIESIEDPAIVAPLQELLASLGHSETSV